MGEVVVVGGGSGGGTGGFKVSREVGAPKRRSVEDEVRAHEPTQPMIIDSTRPQFVPITERAVGLLFSPTQPTRYG